MSPTNKEETILKFVQRCDQVESFSLSGSTTEQKKASLLAFFKAADDKFEHVKKNNIRRKG
jgi:hypothetical protein